ncbi:MAG: iron-containing alcohol dehydrogenase [Bermanella sp.]
MTTSQATLSEQIQFKLHGVKLKAMGFGLKLMPIRDTQVFTGSNGIEELAKIIAKYNLKKALIVTTPGAVKRGYSAKVSRALSNLGIGSTVFSNVIPDPTFATVNEGLAVLKDHDCDCAIALGGGSVMDAAKAMIVAATNDKPVEQLMGMRKGKNNPLPFYAIPTTSGTGSEVTNAAVISEDNTHIKRFMIDSRTVAKAAVLDPSLSVSLPKHITAETGMDALTHALEAYISQLSNPESDALAVQAIKQIFEVLPVCYEDGSNLAARQTMAEASLTAGKAFRKAMLGYVHAISHQLGALYGTAHGLGNAMLLPLVVDYSKDKVADKLANLAVMTGLGRADMPKNKLSQLLVDKLVSLNKQLNIPTKLETLKEEDIPKLALRAYAEALKIHAAPRYMGKQDIEALLKNLL